MAEPRSDNTTTLVVVGGSVALVGVGLYLASKAGQKPGIKRPGDDIGATIAFRAKGNPAKYKVGFGLTPHSIIPEAIKQFVWRLVDVPMVLGSFNPFSFVVSAKLGSVIPAGDVDAFVFIQSEAGTLNDQWPFTGYLATRYYQNVFKVG